MPLARTCSKLALLTICFFQVAFVMFDVFGTRQNHHAEVASCTEELDHEHGHSHGYGTRSAVRASTGKVSMIYGDPEPVYERGLHLHDLHNQRFGYPMFLLKTKTLPEYWSKPSYILKVLLSELEKSERERLKWLMWVDADIVLMNQNIPLEIFLPADEHSEVHMLVTDDHNGLNNGVFFIRVHEWSVWLMSAVTSFKVYNANCTLRYGDQSALELLIKKEDFKMQVRHVPQHWFNGYAGNRGKPDPLPTLPDQRPEIPSHAKYGALLVHFPAHYAVRARRMNLWLNEAELHRPPWEVPLNDTSYMLEINEYWNIDTKLEEAIWRKEQRRQEAAETMEKEAAEHQALYEKQLALDAKRMEAEKIEGERREEEAQGESLKLQQQTNKLWWTHRLWGYGKI